MTSVQLAERIIHEQELVIGPLAWREAKKVHGLVVEGGKTLGFKGDAKKVLEDLVWQYESLFGPASLEVCRDAVRSVLPSIPAGDVPDVLR
jgi:hypothetical protein